MIPAGPAREFTERIERAAEALRAGNARALTYTVRVDVEDVVRVGGTTSDRLGPVADRSGTSVFRSARWPDWQRAVSSAPHARSE